MLRRRSRHECLRYAGMDKRSECDSHCIFSELLLLYIRSEQSSRLVYPVDTFYQLWGMQARLPTVFLNSPASVSGRQVVTRPGRHIGCGMVTPGTVAKLRRAARLPAAVPGSSNAAVPQRCAPSFSDTFSDLRLQRMASASSCKRQGSLLEVMAKG